MTPPIGSLTQRIRKKFDEAPGLQISVEEGVRFWSLDADTCAKVLSALHNAGFLARTQDGRYHRRRAYSAQRAPPSLLCRAGPFPRPK